MRFRLCVNLEGVGAASSSLEINPLSSVGAKCIAPISESSGELDILVRLTVEVEGVPE